MPMGLFSREKEEPVRQTHPSVHQQLVAVSFNHVRKDVQNLYEWIRYLHQQNKAQQDLIHHLSRQIQNHGLQKEAGDQREQAHLQELRSRLVDVEKKISQAQQSSISSIKSQASSEEIVSKITEMIGRMQAKPSSSVLQGATSLQEKVIKKVQQNSKEYIKNVMRQLIVKYAKISGMQLREIVVDEQALCSRSSFYRLLGELEHEGALAVSQIGKEKVFRSPSDADLEQIRNF